MPTAAALRQRRRLAPGAALLERAFGEGAPSALQIVVREPDAARRAVGARA